MSNPYFQFKKFTVWHDRCAMKVGTDGVLVGTLAPIPQVGRVLDVGTGTGLVALIVAQRFNGPIDAVEIVPEAAEQAVENVAKSPWSQRIKVTQADFNDFETDCKYELIVSNPPYFVDSLRNPDSQRSMARHADSLNFEQLFEHSHNLLVEDGKLCIIVPSEAEKMVTETAWRHHLVVQHIFRIHSKPQKPCRRVVITFSKYDFLKSFPSTADSCTDLFLMDETGNYTKEYRELTADFYLKL